LFRRYKIGWIVIIGVTLLVTGAFAWMGNRPIVRPPGVLVPDEPVQVSLRDAKPIRIKGYHLTPVAQFDLKARVLGKRYYRTDRGASLAPYDLTVGWGPMSDSDILDDLPIRLDNRAYAWDGDNVPLTTKEIILHSTNMHLIPATPGIESVIRNLREGHIIRLSGKLVNVLANDGLRWQTSTTRRDAGVGACEIVWVERLEILDE
jgi:hypothetical protein